MSKYEHIKDNWVREALEEYKEKIRKRGMKKRLGLSLILF